MSCVVIAECHTFNFIITGCNCGQSRCLVQFLLSCLSILVRIFLYLLVRLFNVTSPYNARLHQIFILSQHCVVSVAFHIYPAYTLHATNFVCVQIREIIMAGHNWSKLCNSISYYLSLYARAAFVWCVCASLCTYIQSALITYV